jgi:hypothetical protein
MPISLKNKRKKCWLMPSELLLLIHNQSKGYKKSTSQSASRKWFTYNESTSRYDGHTNRRRLYRTNSNATRILRLATDTTRKPKDSDGKGNCDTLTIWHLFESQATECSQAVTTKCSCLWLYHPSLWVNSGRWWSNPTQRQLKRKALLWAHLFQHDHTSRSYNDMSDAERSSWRASTQY